MAFKMTPGIKGNPSMNRIKNLGACGGPGQPPCEPRFQKEVEEKRMQPVDRSSSARSKSIKAKIKQSPIKDAPVKPAPKPKLQINLPKGYEFKDRLAEKMFYSMFEDALERGKYKNQEELDKAIMRELKGTIDGPKDPKDPGGPIMHDPKNPPVVRPPGKFDPKEPIKGGGEFEASPGKGVIKK
jgi:hypothetical protein